ncbi:MAG: ATP-binding protein [Dehalococcoidales bacterium]|nr:ATP-binding protein [Dehalococcoidales bacterium]
MTETQVINDAEQLLERLGQLPEPVVKPAFIVVSGLPGTGKSFFCRRLAERIPVIILESDAMRKTLFPSPAYSVEESARLFQAIHHLIERLLKKGIPIVLDATNLAEKNRERLYHIAYQLNAKLTLVRVEAPPEVVQERLRNRTEGTASEEDHSEADWAVFQKMKTSVQKINRNHFAVDTSRDIAPVLNKIVREVNR